MLIDFVVSEGVIDTTPTSFYESKVILEIKRLGDLINDEDERAHFVATEESKWSRITNDEVYKYNYQINNSSYAALKSHRVIQQMRFNYLVWYANKKQRRLKQD
jgi:hypothetical protein